MTSITQTWTQKYAPKSTKEIIGQGPVVAEILEYIQQFPRVKKRALLLHGTPGSGKTSTIYAIANDLNCEVLEVNASDTRNKDQIETIIGSASKSVSLFGGSKLILIDEVDGIAGNQDRGGVPALIKAIEESKFPIIMTCNDPYEQKFNSLRSKSNIITFQTLKPASIVPVLRQICEKEGIQCEEEALKQIAHLCQGDLRGAINDLQSVCEGKKSITKSDLDVLGEREYKTSMFDALLTIFKQSDLAIVERALDNVAEDPDEVFMWLDENIPKEYTKMGDLYRAYDALSLADVHRGRIMKRQYWRLLVYVNLFMTCGVASAKNERYSTIAKYGPTMRILKMWQAKMSNAKRDSIAEKLGALTHTSKKRAMKEHLPYFKLYAKAKQKQMGSLFEKLALNEEEREWLLR